MPWQRIGAAIGMHQGGAVRSALDALWRELGLDRSTGRSDVRNSVAFTVAIVALAAKLAKADGVATQIEAHAFEQLYHVPHEQAANVKRMFDLAQQDTAGFEAYAGQIARLLGDDTELKRDVFEGLFHIASADGVLHDAEEAYLRTVSVLFGLDAADYRRTRALFVHDQDDPYHVLGVAHDIADDELRAEYRRLVKAHHPDTLMGHGVPEEFIDQATRKLATINEAYERIARERGL